jgi:DMSO/TMAO reductase YedYZ molybdopterin-dependent catalytic subunit
MLTNRTYAALSGLLATIAALSVGELMAGLVRSWYSPVLAVGDTAIFYTPRPVKEFAIAAFGTNDKIALIAGTLIITLIFGTVLGIIGRKRLPVAWAGIALFGVLGVAASTFQDGIASSIPSLITVVVGIPVITLLLRRAPAPATASDSAPDSAPASASEETAAAGPGNRRTFLALSGGVVVASAAAVATGRSLVNARGQALDQARADIASQIGQTAAPTGSATESALRPLGLVDDPLPPLPAGVDLEIEGLVKFQTPDPEFYRIDTALTVPQINSDDWTLRIHGMVDTELEFGYEDLLRRPDLIEADITMTCVSNEVGGDLVGSGRWTGVPLTNLLEEAGVQSSANQVVGRDGTDFTTGFPVEVLSDGRPAMLALLFNGEPLSPERGFPARVVVPGLYGYVSATKWITEIELTTFEDFEQYWVERGWDEEAPIKLQSRIDVPRPLQRVPTGEVVVAGVAWDQTVGIEAVEIKVDDGEWQPAELAEELNLITWRQWRFAWDAPEPGNYRLMVRATNKAGEVQTDERQPPFPNGATGLMTLLVTVAENA